MKKKAFAPEFWQYVMDSSSLINIDRNEGIRMLARRKEAIIISKQVAYEVANDPKVKKTDPLRQFVLRNPEIIAQFTDNEKDEYMRIASQSNIASGEASAMAIALKRKLALVTDDKKAKSKASNHGIETLSWQEFLRRS